MKNQTYTLICSALLSGSVITSAHSASTDHVSNAQKITDKHSNSQQLHYVKTDVFADFKRHNTALLVIDAQQGYIPNSPDYWVNIYYPDMPKPPENNYYQTDQQIDNIVALTKAAASKSLTTQITYEGFPEDHSPFITKVEQELPVNTKRYYKAYFNSTTEQDVKAGMQKLREQGIHQIIVAGAETDVCVMQTVLGLRKMGFDVYLASDAVFSSELYTRPTFKRLQQAGVKLAKTDQLIAAINGDDKLTLSPRYNVKPRYNLFQADRQQMATLHFNQDEVSISKAEHDNKSAVDYRMRQWSEYTSYVMAPAMGVATFHISGNNKPYSVNLVQPDNLQNVRNINQAITGMQAEGKTQAIISGVVSKSELIGATTKLIEAGIVPVIMEDNLMGKQVDPINYLDKVYSLGAIPATYKSLGYEITEAIYYLDLSPAETEAHYYLYGNIDQLLPELLPRVRQF
ncbi:isochorismatase family cysteine hydrolase [Motilimonas sp. E26]|uniref:cysteine hydrolase family protein n=1 Tax=Motilimonas sp. E26 TaxID=2865674 RepID=UPI001E32F18D|nr:isochorismatase family cysteine hydrolase [Motilimonas sp. E26]MCE0555456.1 cysteine hydrolase [Motilimonas sp. E26]